MFPVEVAYLKEPTGDYVREAVNVVWGIHLQVCYLALSSCWSILVIVLLCSKAGAISWSS